jgi:hypothetical protein
MVTVMVIVMDLIQIMDHMVMNRKNTKNLSGKEL